MNKNKTLKEINKEIINSEEYRQYTEDIKQIIIKNPEILNFILRRVNRSYEKIFLLIEKIDRLSLEQKRQLTIPLIKELI